MMADFGNFIRMQKQYIGNLFWNNKSQTLEGNIFISASVLGIVVGLIAVFWNIYIGLPLVQNILIGAVVVFFALVYYYARYKQVYNNKVFISVTLFVLSFSWFFNDGIKGSVPIIYVLALSFFLSITKAKYHIRVLLFTLINFVSLVFLEVLWGEKLMIYSHNREAVIVDNIFGYIVTIFFSFMLFSCILKSYYKERNKLVKNEQEMKKLNDSKDMFFNIIAHDLRSPFAGLLGVAELMSNKSKELSVQEYQYYSSLNLRTMTKTFDLLENLLNWGKIQQGKIQINPQRFNLKELVEESALLFEDQYKKKMLELSIEISDIIEVNTDRNSILTVIRNLVSNSIKYTPNGGKILIYAEEKNVDKVEIVVKDSGIGMSKDIIDSLFQFDVKANRPGLDGEQSIGLGLIISKGLVESQGGDFIVESEENNGTCFRFSVNK